MDDHDEEKIGVATGNWGCGVFGGDPEVKIMLQWLAISQVYASLFSFAKTIVILYSTLNLLSSVWKSLHVILHIWTTSPAKCRSG